MKLSKEQVLDVEELALLVDVVAARLERLRRVGQDDPCWKHDTEKAVATARELQRLIALTRVDVRSAVPMKEGT